jgi:hypothetical protein
MSFVYLSTTKPIGTGAASSCYATVIATPPCQAIPPRVTLLQGKKILTQRGPHIGASNLTLKEHPEQLQPTEGGLLSE